MPRFFYFDEYAELAGRTRIEPLAQALRTGDATALDQAQVTALALLQLGFANEEVADTDYETRSGEMQACGCRKLVRAR
jgi:hypothetical protein